MFRISHSRRKFKIRKKKKKGSKIKEKIEMKSQSKEWDEIDHAMRLLRLISKQETVKESNLSLFGGLETTRREREQQRRP